MEPSCKKTIRENGLKQGNALAKNVWPFNFPGLWTVENLSKENRGFKLFQTVVNLGP